MKMRLKRGRFQSLPSALNMPARRTLPALLALLILPQSSVFAYVTTPPGVLPLHKHKAYLESLTNEILASPPGSFSPDKVRETIPRLMSAWACHPISTGYMTSSSASSANLEFLPNIPPSGKGRRKRSKSKPDSQPPGASSIAATSTGLQYSLTIERLLKRLVDERYTSSELEEIAVSTEVYNTVLTSWARTTTEHCYDAEIALASAIRATSILVQMQELYEQQGSTQPNEMSFRTVFSAWEGAATVAASSPDSSQLFHVASHLHSILDWMADLYFSKKNEYVKSIVLDREVFHSIMTLMGKSSVLRYAGIRAIEKCERALYKMEQLAEHAFYHEAEDLEMSIWPDTTTYNLVLLAWSKADTAESEELTREVVANRTYQILQHMERFSHIEPNKVTYTSVVHALAKCGTKGHASKANKLLHKMEERFQKTGGQRLELLPDTMCYNHVINALAKSRDLHGLPRKAMEVLLRMKELYYEHDADVCKPDVFTYSSVIGACAFVAGSKKVKQRAFQLAIDLWKELKSNPKFGTPNQVTYGTLLRACANLLAPEYVERDEAVRDIFEECKKCGFVNHRVIDQMKAAASRSLYHHIMEGYTRDEYPSEWGCQLPDGSYKHRTNF